MKFIIADQLACLAHIKHNTQPSHFWIKISILTTYVQLIALLLPLNGYGFWKYEDGHFRLLQILTQSQLIIPLLANFQFDFSIWVFAISLIFIFMMCGILVIFAVFGFYDNQNPKDHFSIRKLLFYFIMLTTTTFQLPLLFLFYSQIIVGESTLSYQNQFFGPQSIINLIGLILFDLLVIFSQYFLRAYTFVPFNYMQQRYNAFQVIHFILNNVFAAFYFLSDVEYAQLALIHLQLFFKVIESLISKPFIPFINEDHFMLSIVTEVINILVSINVFTNNQYIQENQLLYYMLIFGSISYYLADAFYGRKRLDYSMNYSSCIPYTQEMHFMYLILNRKPAKRQFFLLYFLWKTHEQNCVKYKKYDNMNCIQLTHQTIFCILGQELERAKLDGKQMYEELQLFYINYMAEFANKPLLAYVEIKKYITQKSQQSYYFQIIRYQIGKYVQSLIIQRQSQMRIIKVQQQQEQEKQLSIMSILETLQFQEEFLPKISEILNQKINFWTNQIKGFNNIYEIERLALTQSSNIQSLIHKIIKFSQIDVLNLEDHLAFSTNVLNIKLISIFYSTIMNDYYGTQICEAEIVEIFNLEHTYSEDVVCNLTLVKEKAAIVLLSMVKSRGRIANQDQRLIARYFGFDDQEFSQIENISSLMPQFFSEKHDNLLSDYLQSAKSIFFDDYKMVFSISRKGLLVPQQLKIDNDFSSMDDYVLIGCLSEIKHSSDFVLFGDDGYLIGCTQSFFETFFTYTNYTNQTRLFSPELLEQVNIYMLFPSIFELLNDTRKRLRSEFEMGTQDKYCKIWKFYNPKDIFEDEFNYQLTLKQLQNDVQSLSYQKQRTSTTTHDLNRAPKYQFGENFETKSTKQKTLKYIHQLPVYNPVLQHNVLEYIRKLETKEKQQFISKVELHFKTIGIKEQKKAYFIMEVNDIRKSVDAKSNESLVNNQYSNALSIYQQTTLNNSLSINQENETCIGSMTVAKEGVTPNMLRINDVSSINKKKKQQMMYELQMLGQESGRDSISYAPLSQRIQFISPSSKQQQLQGLIDRDFTDLQMQLDYEQAVLNDIEIPEPSQVKGISNSNEKQEKSNNLLQLIQQNQLNQQRDELEISAKKSRSSNTSGTSGMQAIQVIKKFQQKTDMTVSLQIILAINCSILVTMIIYLIIHLANVITYHDDVLQTLTNISAPLLFSRYFCKILSFAWNLVFYHFELMDNSDYIILQTIQQINNTANNMFSTFHEMYSTFINIEVQGLLSQINLNFLYQENENVTYTYFIDYLSSISDVIFEVQYCTLENVGKVIDRDYIDSMLALRYNFQNVVKMNSELIDSLNVIFFNLQQSILQEFQIQISIEIVILSLIMLLQILYWNQLEKYCQQIILLVGRLQEDQAQQQIIRFSFLNETLTYIAGEASWKSQNYYKLAYLPLNQLGIESLKTESRLLKDYQLQFGNKNKRFLSPIMEENQKKQRKNQSVSLNARISNTSTSIYTAIMIITAAFIMLSAYIVGGYLVYNEQSTALYPTQQLTLNFIRFTSKQDITVSSALITKTQLSLYSKLSQYYSSEEVKELPVGKDVIQTFITLYSNYYSSLIHIYEYIIASNQINGDDESVLLNLYGADFCLVLADLIPFCNFNQDFANTYGQYSENDNNREFLSTGIQGVVSRMDALYKQIFQYEIANSNYEPDIELVLSQINTQAFDNAIFEHYIDTTNGTNMFIDNLIRILQRIMTEDLNLIQTYYLAAGIPLFLLYCLIFGIWMNKTNHRLIKLRLILTNLPIEILTEQHTLTLLKRLK